MAYPDFISSAPNYAEQFLRINRNQQETDNDAVTNWLKSIQGAKLSQDMARQPDLDDQAAQLNQARIADMAKGRDQEDTRLGIEGRRLTDSEALQNLDKALKAIQINDLQKSVSDKASVDQFTNDITKLSPEEFADPDKGGKVVNDWAAKVNNPSVIYGAYADIAGHNPVYQNEALWAKERQGWGQNASDAWNASLQEGMERNDAMAVARQQQRADDEDMKAQAIKDAAYAKASGKVAALDESGAKELTKEQVSAARIIVNQTLGGQLDKLQIKPEQRAAIAADILNSVGDYTDNDGKVDTIKLQQAIQSRLLATPTAVKSRYGL
jgi:hypothetical protein